MTRFFGHTVITTAPAADPLTTAETKTYLRIDSSDEDTLVANLIKAARIQCEAETKRVLINTTFTLYLPCFPGPLGRIWLIKGPLSSVTSVKYYDSGGTLTTVDSADYQVNLKGKWGTIVPAINGQWPTTQDDKENAVEIAYVAGFGASSSYVPETLRTGMLLFCSHLYENRKIVEFGNVSAIPMSVKALWDTESVKEAW